MSDTTRVSTRAINQTRVKSRHKRASSKTIAWHARVASPRSHLRAHLFNTLDGKNWNGSNDWMSSKNACSWKGVAREGNTITRLELASNNMKGRFDIVKLLKDSLGLKKLSIRNNDLEIIMLPYVQQPSFNPKLIAC